MTKKIEDYRKRGKNLNKVELIRALRKEMNNLRKIYGNGLLITVFCDKCRDDYSVFNFNLKNQKMNGKCPMGHMIFRKIARYSCGGCGKPLETENITKAGGKHYVSAYCKNCQQKDPLNQTIVKEVEKL